MEFNDKQLAALAAVNRGESIIIQAPGGTGKTAVAAEMGRQNPGKKIYYCAFNKEIVESAKKNMPSNVTCYTIHAYAMGRTGRFYAKRLPRPNDPTFYRMSNKDTAAYLALADIELEGKTISAAKCASLVMRGISNFCKSSSWQISGWFIPHIAGIMPEEMKMVRDTLDSAIKSAWEDIKNTRGKLNFSAEHYVKLWTLDVRAINIAADIVIIDEAQDVMACVISVLKYRERKGKQLVIIGDEYQAINEWNGAENSMGQFPDFEKFTFDITYRFGQDIADLANDWLEAMGADMRLIGMGPDSVIGPVDEPAAILCRTNADTITAAMAEIESGRTVHLLGDIDAFTAIADAALKLQAGQSCEHYLFAGITTWTEAQTFATSGDPDAEEIRTWVKLIDTHGAQTVKDMLSQLVGKDRADVLVSTAHKTKGREYETVRVFGFPDQSELTRPPQLADFMLAYVTVTRARKRLDPGALGQPYELAA